MQHKCAHMHTSRVQLPGACSHCRLCLDSGSLVFLALHLVQASCFEVIPPASACHLTAGVLGSQVHDTAWLSVLVLGFECVTLVLPIYSQTPAPSLLTHPSLLSSLLPPNAFPFS